MWFACFPNFAAEIYSDRFVVLATHPTAPDETLLERLQRGRRSVAFAGAIMSPAWEAPAHRLARRVVETIVAD